MRTGLLINRRVSSRRNEGRGKREESSVVILGGDFFIRPMGGIN